MSTAMETDPATGSGTAVGALTADTAVHAESAQRTRSEPVPLRRNVNFQLLWSGSAAAFVGLEVADIAYPLMILAITHSPFKAGLFATVQLIAMMLTALPSGQLLDRADRRRVLLAAELVRAAAVSGVAVAWYLGGLTFWQLMATAAVLGGVQPFGAARMLMIRTVVPDEQLTTALTQEQVRDHGAMLVGPPLGGALYAVSRALPFVFAAVMMAVSFLCALFVRLPAKAAPAESAPPADAEESAEAPAAAAASDDGVFAGLRLVFRSPLMRATALTLTLVNMIGFPLYLCLIVLLQQQNQSPRSIGVVLGTMAAGGLAGTLLVKPSHKLLRPGWLLITACAIFTACIAGVAYAHGPVFAAALMFAANLVVPAAVVMINILILQQIPDRQRGRANAALQTLMGLGMPVGMLVSGAGLQYFSPVTVLVAMAAWMGVALLYAVSQRALRDAQWPDAQTAPDGAEQSA